MPKDSPLSVEQLGSTTEFKGKIWDVVSEEFLLGDQRLSREFVEHPGAVAVVVTDADGRVLLIRQYRHPVRQQLWELPAGLLDVPGESEQQAAARELLEEAGLIAEHWKPLIDFYTTPGGNNELIRVYHATGITETERPEAEAEERYIQAGWFSLKEVVSDILEGNIKSPTAVVGILALVSSRQK